MNRPAFALWILLAGLFLTGFSPALADDPQTPPAATPAASASTTPDQPSTPATTATTMPAASPDTAKPADTAKTPADPPKADAPKSSDTKADAVKPDATKPETPKAADAKTEGPKPAPIPQQVLEVWDLLLQSRLKELDVVYDEAKALQDRLSASSRQFTANLSKVEQDYQRLSAMAQVSRGQPMELSVVSENLHYLQTQLAAIMNPLEGALLALQNRLAEITMLEKGAGTVEDGKGGKTVANAADTPELRDFLKKLDQTQRFLNQLQNRVQRVLLPAHTLNTRMTEQQNRLSGRLPALWRDYYLSPSGRLYDAATWGNLNLTWQSMKDASALHVTAELPVGLTEWYNVLARMASVLIPLHVLLFVSRRMARRAPPALANGWERLTKHSMPWLITGLALHFSAWTSLGDAYRVLSVVGTFLLSIGQMALAWDLYTFENPASERRSRLWPLAAPLLWGLLLLLLNLPGPVLGAGWLLFLAVALVLEHRRTEPENQTGLVRNLLAAHMVVLWIAALMTVMGWGRLSILVCMGYAALAVSVQQAVGLMRLMSLISGQLPEKGLSALFGGVLLALLVPAILVVMTLATGLWILAYPGGAELLHQMAMLDVNIGRTSFNMLQVLLIISAFYVTRSIIVVGRTFLQELPANGVRMDQSLLGPIQVAYTYILWALFGLYALSALGFSLTNLAVVAGGLSVGIGFGLQNIINNFVSGLLVIFGQTLREGDVIEVGNLTGTVKKINVRSTVVETGDNAVIFVPNAEFLSGRLTNWTRNGRMVRREVAVGVAYGSDVPKVIKLLHGIADEHRSVLKYPEPMVLFNDFGASSLDFVLRFWVADIMHALPIMTELRVEIERVFRENDIEIAFPQLDVHVKREPKPIPVACLDTPNSSSETPDA